MSRLTAKAVGTVAEQLACTFLQQQGYTLLAQNYQWSGGEIDLVMQEKETIVFVEVRYRADQRFGGAVASITSAKQQKLRRTATHFLQQQFGSEQIACRFDIIALTSTTDQEFTITDWIKNAF